MRRKPSRPAYGYDGPVDGIAGDGTEAASKKCADRGRAPADPGHGTTGRRARDE
ncbi:hypothetical protein ACIA6T_26075 [Streptomyces sp. NPDC051740]|uniref:hypothetical protein n=1 Tax=Streptomyces sp. NPDC051740 TaxID=3365673 RepID=UPI003795773A